MIFELTQTIYHNTSTSQTEGQTDDLPWQCRAVCSCVFSMPLTGCLMYRMTDCVHLTGASYHDYGDLRVILGVIIAMSTAVLIIVCVVHRRRRRSRQQRKSAEQRRMSAADALAAAAAADAAVDGRPDGVRDGSIEVRYVGRSANCTPTHAAGNSVTSSRNPGMTSSSGRARDGGGKRLLKEKTEKVSIV